MKSTSQRRKPLLVESVILALLAVTCLVAPLGAQLEAFGLPGERVTAVALFPSELVPWDNYLTAGTDSNGVFIRNLISPDSNWVNFGLVGKKITALHVYHWGVGPAENNSIFAGIQPDGVADSTLIYRRTKFPTWWDSLWFASDSGLDAHSINQIKAISGIFYCGHTPPQPIFAAGSMSIFRAIDFPPQLQWQSVLIAGSVNVIQKAQHLYAVEGHIWAGGENDVSFPVFAKTTDGGDNWNTYTPLQWHPNACYSLAIDPLRRDTVYAGLSGVVIKTTDGGSNWSSTSLQNVSVVFNGLAVNPVNPNHLLAGGIAPSNAFALYETLDGGDNWTLILETDTIAGISSMDAQIEGSEFVVYMGTFGDGVYRYRSPLTGVKDQANIAADFRLFPNYPNPFNPTTTISWQLPVGSHVELAVYNLLGQKIRTLVDGKQPVGVHQVEWDGRDDAGKEVASGVYVVQLKTDATSQSRKMILLR